MGRLGWSRTPHQLGRAPHLTRIYYNDTFAGGVLKQIGFKRPAVEDKPEFADDVTKERIPDMEGDRLFYFVYEAGDGGANDAVWNTAGGVLAANALLDDIARVYEVDTAQ